MTVKVLAQQASQSRDFWGKLKNFNILIKIDKCEEVGVDIIRRSIFLFFKIFILLEVSQLNKFSATAFFLLGQLRNLI